MTLPKRRHAGCDPMCEECQDWMYQVMGMMKPVAHEAMKAFWDVVYTLAPDLPPASLDRHAAELLRDACEEAVGHWAVENSPEPVSATPEPKRSNVMRFEPMGRKAQPEAVYSPFK